MGPQGNNYWSLSGNNLYPTTITNNVGIGKTGPNVPLDVSGNLITSADATINSLTIGTGGSNVPSNTAVGYFALNNNTTGLSNTAIGYTSLNANTIGNSNTAIGHTSLENNTVGGMNTTVGYAALLNIQSGNNNVAIGDSAGFDLSGNSSNNTFLGTNTNVSSNTSATTDN